MAGTNLERLMAQQQPQQMQAPVVTPEMQQYFVAPQQMQMPESYGAARFLSGQMAIPMTFNVPVPQYESPNLTPGDFQNFMRALGSGKSANYTIPVLNPDTGTYTSTQYGKPK